MTVPLSYNLDNVKSPLLDNICTKLLEFDPDIFPSFNKNSFDTKYFQQSEFTLQSNSDDDFSVNIKH